MAAFEFILARSRSTYTALVTAFTGFLDNNGRNIRLVTAGPNKGDKVL